MTARRQRGPWCSDNVLGLRARTLSWTVIDVETSGLDPGRHVLREYAAFTVSPELSISKVASWSLACEGPHTASHGLLAMTSTLRAGSVLLAHNLAFDLSFLSMHPDAPVELLRPERWLCTMQMLRAPQSLDQLAARFGQPVEGRHSALGDARTLARVLVALLERAGSSEAADVRSLAATMSSASRRTTANQAPQPAAGWPGVRAELDHVVPCSPASLEQRAAFRAATRLLADPHGGPAHPVEHDRVVAALRAARVTSSVLDVLVAEIAGRQAILE